MKALSKWVFILFLTIILSLFTFGLWAVMEPEPALAVTYTVTNINDSGAGSLRQAIIDANTLTPATADIINFNIAAAPGPVTITPVAALPPITDPVWIDGTTQPVFAPGTVIELDGSNPGAAMADGLLFQGAGANNSQVSGLVINRWQQSGIAINGVTVMTIDGNYIGTDWTGTIPLPNVVAGINVYNVSSGITIGGLAAARRNLISGNGLFGILIDNSTGNAVLGNFIGTDVTGWTMPVPNNADGIHLTNGANSNTIGGSAAGSPNAISGNGGCGVTIDGSNSNTVEGNYIGTDFGGINALPNGGDGVYLINGSSANTIGGSAAGQGNVISGNTSMNIRLDGAGGNFVEGNYIGTDMTGTVALSGGGIYIVNSANNNTIGGNAITTPAIRNVISGNNSAGIDVDGSTGTTIQGNFIGPDATGASMGNSSYGINLYIGANSNTVGGSTAGEGNVISANGLYGVRVRGTGNAIEGNFIGTDPTGATAMPNVSAGIRLEASADNNTIGGNAITTPAVRNVISGNNGYGIYVNSCTGVTIQGNYIGIDATGTSAVANTTDGVDIYGGSLNTIGGTTAAEGNVISGNSWDGISIDNSTGNVVSANMVGTDAAGTAAVPNGSDGIQISSLSSNNTVGGTSTGERNIISGNLGPGVLLTNCSYNNVQGNYIGTNPAGNAAVPNTSGVNLGGSSNDNLIGGANPGEWNLISGNTNSGINVYACTSNDVQGNLIGTDATGTLAVPNGMSGVYIFSGASGNTIGGSTSGTGNTISGNGMNGVEIDGATGNFVEDNFIGTDVSGTAALKNNSDGVYLHNGANSNTIGGNIPGRINLISGNSNFGVGIDGSTGNTISNNYIGVDVTGTTALANGSDGVNLANGANNNTIGGAAATNRNIISGNGGDGINIKGSTGNTISANYVGTDAVGTGGIPNTDDGVNLALSADNNTVGGTTSGQCNVISQNGGDGIEVDASSGNSITGNYVGTELTGTSSLPNGSQGVRLMNGSTGNTIGGVTTGERNVISGNTGSGVSIDNSSGNFVEGNYIGIDTAGTTAIPNGVNGVNILSGATSNSVGGTTSGERNVISGNGTFGVYIFAATGNTVSANYIGTDAAGSSGVGNSSAGVFMLNGANNNVIGGTTSGERNVISDNTGDGIVVGNSTGNIIQGNYIGTDAGGTAALPNNVGINCTSNANGTTIGGSAAGANLIANNNPDGVAITGSTDCVVSHNRILNNTGIGVVVWDAAAVRNKISENSIYGSGKLGIDLLGDGVTPNDGNNNNPAKPNLGYNFPVFSSDPVPVAAGNTYVSGTAPPNATVEFYWVGMTPDPSGHGEGDTYLGNAAADGSGNFTATLTGLSAGDQLAAIAISPSGDPSGQGNTSEFSANITTATAYAVSASVSGTGGTIDPASQVPWPGDDASIDIIPDAGYHIDTICDNGMPQAVADPYVIENVQADHTVVVTFAADVQPFYFAEGYTGAGFQEYLCLGNPGDTGTMATITYMFPDGSTQEQEVELAAKSRTTVNVNASVGEGREVSAMVRCDEPIVAERPMYFSYQGSWSGGHDTVGASETSCMWYFAEGYTGAGFDEWICVLNPGDEAAELTFRFQTQEEGEKVVTGLSVPAHSRGSFKANDLLGGGAYQTSLALQSTAPVVAERPMYFSYSGTGGWGWTGGHCVMGASSLSTEYYFAEGTTRGGFEEWLTIQNPGLDDIEVQATYMLGTGQTVEVSYPVPAAKRSTVYVPNEVGIDQDVSVQLTCSSPFLAERPMYFDYSGMGAWGWQGGHCVIGATASATDWFLAEGYTGGGFEEWICIQNPGGSGAAVTVTYYPEGGADPMVRDHTVAANSRYTIPVNIDAGADLSISTGLSSDQPIIVERPMYFNYNGTQAGGHDVVGYMP